MRLLISSRENVIGSNKEAVPLPKMSSIELDRSFVTTFSQGQAHTSEVKN